MKISDYKKRKLQWYNRLINAFLILGLSLVLILLLTLTVSESTIKHFEDNAENLSSELASVVIENVDDMLSDDDIQDVMVEHNLDELPEGDLCEYSDQIETDDEDVLFVFERECANGSLDRETMIDAVLDVKMDSFEEDAAVQIAESLGE
ncbi:MAG: hypothetical protein KKF89_00765, partial [Nanoarchaeota archaeon]|nr:hypothetical protein [Nanoarchaeota archaeon]